MDHAFSEQLQALASYLGDRRTHILFTWRQRVEGDAQLTTASVISRAQFYDHIPLMLDAFEQLLCAQDTLDQKDATAARTRSAAEHGLQRWQQGFSLSQAMREWTHLHLSVLEELDRFASGQSVDAAVMRSARDALVRLCGDGVSESAARYSHLQQVEAASRLRDLQQALVHLQVIDRERAERWREAAHDLRNTVNVVTSAATVLDRKGVELDDRSRMSQTLLRSTTALQTLLVDLMDLARLEAGQERRKLSQFDAARLIGEFCEPLRAIAAERNLFFQTDGIERLPVEGDPVKVQRIAQNLLTNALSATERGGIRVTWEERNNDTERPQWILCVQDTGPGLDPQAPLEGALKRATDDAHEVEDATPTSEDPAGKLEPADTLHSRSPHPRRGDGGDGIGLTIVKRLCELLDASLELETAAGEGTTFRVIFPRDYSVPRR